jgi:hypothetical protein
MAVILEEAMRGWMNAHLEQREQIAAQAADRFIAVLGQNAEPPTAASLERAVAAARDEIFVALTAEALLNSLPYPPDSAGAREALRGSLLSLVPPWTLPPPPLGRGMPTERLAVAAAVGSLLGMTILGGLFHITLGLRGIGMLIGAPGGAAAAMYAVGRLAESKRLRAGLKTILGAAWTADLLSIAAPGFGTIWRRLAGFGLIRRVLVYAGAITLLSFTRGSARYDVAAYHAAAHAMIRLAVDASALLLVSLSKGEDATPRAEVMDAGLARAVQELHRCSARDMPAAAESLLLEARRLGLEGLSTPPRFTQPRDTKREKLRWERKLETHYQPFGLIEDGDVVIVEDEPVIQHGVILEKGRVRKQRA